MPEDRPQKYFLNMNLNVRARMTASDELLRQKRLGINIYDEKVIQGLVEQRSQIEIQQKDILRIIVISVFLSFVSWQGGSINIPGFGIAIRDIPSFLEIALIIAAIGIMYLPYVFLNMQIYEAIISSLVMHYEAKQIIDEDIVVLSKFPGNPFIKYASKNVPIYRKNGYIILKTGIIYNSILVLAPVLSFVIGYIFLIFSVFYIAHFGLGESWIDWLVYGFICFLIAVGFYAISANFISLKYEMDFDVLEKIDHIDGEKLP